MSKPSTYALCWSREGQVYELSTDGQQVQLFGLEDGAAWLHWLETHNSFSFQGLRGRMSVVKETRPRGSGYWYAYRSHGRRTTKRYLGRTGNLSLARLEEIAAMLANTSASSIVKQPREATPLPHPILRTPIERSSSTPLLSSKLSAPRLPFQLVERTHLLSRLDTALAHTLTLLQAPAGFGKTTLANQWIISRRAKQAFPAVAWVSLDAGDNDSVRFWRYVIAAFQRLQPDLGQSALELLSSAGQSLFAAPPLETALTLLLNDLSQERGLLVLDDYHVIEEPHIHEMLTFFLDHLPTTLHVLLLSRAEPPLPLLRWRARGELSELHLADLRFSSEETATFLQQTLPVPLSEVVLTHLDASLEGWAAGLRLLALSLQGQRTRQEVEQALLSLGERSTPYQPLLDYLVTEILNTQPEPLQRFLLQTSILSHLSGPLCATVTERQDSAALLEAVERAGLLLEALDSEGVWYRYHALFAEALRREAARRMGEEALHSLSLRASHWYEQHERVEEAIEMALQARDLERVALMIERADEHEAGIEPQTLRRWLSQMPEELLHAHPALCLLFAILLRFPQEGKEKMPLPIETSERIEALLHMADEGWRRQGKLAWIGVIDAFRALGAWQTGPMTLTTEYAQRALALWSNDTLEPRVHMWRSLCLGIVGSGYLHEGRFDEARQLILESHVNSRVDSNQHLMCGMLLLLALSYTVQGKLRQSAECYQQALTFARQQEDTEQTADALIGLARLSLEWNDLSTAEQLTREALEMLEDGKELRESAALQLALLRHARGETVTAQQQLTALIARLQPGSTIVTFIVLLVALSWQVRLHLATDDLQGALSSYAALARFEHLISPPQRMALQILQARLSLAEGKTQAARHELERLLPAAQERQDIYDILTIHVLLAQACATDQQEQQAREWLMRALPLAQGEGFIRLFVSEGEQLARLLRQLGPTIQDAALHSYAQTILHAFPPARRDEDAFPPGKTTPSSLLCEPLSPQERRVLRLLATGCTNPQIAQELVVSINTVKDHVKKLYRKLGVNNRLQASEAARRFELL